MSGDLAVVHAGADLAIEYAGFKESVMEFSKGEGANVVYDGIGKDTFEESLASVRPRGTLVVSGYSSGPVPPFDLTKLTTGSVFLTRPTLGHFVSTRDELLWRAKGCFTSSSRFRDPKCQAFTSVLYTRKFDDWTLSERLRQTILR
jgi:NADPH2:quinone reductase